MSLTIMTLAPLTWLAVINVAFLASIGLVAWFLWTRIRRACGNSVGTWDCGYVAPSATMQYTSSSFAEIVVGLFGWVLRPQRSVPELHGSFPAPSTFHSHVPDLVLDTFVIPSIRRGGNLTQALRWLHQGNVHTYLLYVLLTLIVLSFWP